MSQGVTLLKFEEGYRDVPFIDTLGFPTVDCGIKIRPKFAVADQEAQLAGVFASRKIAV